MKTSIRICGVLLVAALTAALGRAGESPKYDPAKEQTFKGLVVEVTLYQCPISGTIGTHLSVKGEAGMVEVHLAPVSFMKDYEVVIRPGDAVEIVGNKLTFADKPSMLARTVKIGEMTYTFRNEKGQPLW